MSLCKLLSAFLTTFLSTLLSTLLFRRSIRFLIAFLVVSFVQQVSVPQAFGKSKLSAVRGANEDYRTSARRISQLDEFRPTGSAYSMKSPNIDMDKLTEWTGADMQQVFNWIRDERFIKTENNFNRRSTWLYPYDGCFARAEVTGQRLQQKSYPKPSKIFVFGNLSVDSVNASGGSVSWWFHVVVGYKKDGVAYVFDPSIEPNYPLTLDDWSKRMGPDYKQFSVCEAGTYGPDDSCDKPMPMNFANAEQKQSGYLSSEWRNLINLGRNPELELGDNPPWLN